MTTILSITCILLLALTWTFRRIAKRCRREAIRAKNGADIERKRREDAERKLAAIRAKNAELGKG